MSLNLASIPLDAAKSFGESSAILMNDVSMTYTQLSHAIISGAEVLQQHGIKRGDHVALFMPNVPQFTIYYYAILYCGAAVVPLNVLFVSDEIQYHLKDSDAKALITWDGFLDKALPATANTACKSIFAVRQPQSSGELPDSVINIAALSAKQNIASLTRDPAPTNADDTAIILYTSGTTGRPKGAELTHFSMFDNARYVCERLTQQSRHTLNVFSKGDIALASLPLFHSFGQTVIQNAFLMNGAAISLLPRFTPQEAAALIAKHKITVFAGVPTMYIALMNTPEASAEQLASLKYAVSGGAPLPEQVIKGFESKFGIPILEGYGLSETSPVACFNSLLYGRKPGTVGPPIDRCEVKIVDGEHKQVTSGEPGEIIIRGTNVMKGYYKRQKETEEVLKSGWFHTGDIGKIDADGFVSIVDRKKEMIIRGGFNVYPREVEEALYAHPAIAEAAVIGVPDETHGEEVMAVVALKAGANLTHDELEKFCRGKLAAYKVPRKSKVLDALPKGPTGKILKRSIRDDILKSLNTGVTA